MYMNLIKFVTAGADCVKALEKLLKFVECEVGQKVEQSTHKIIKKASLCGT